MNKMVAGPGVCWSWPKSAAQAMFTVLGSGCASIRVCMCNVVYNYKTENIVYWPLMSHTHSSPHYLVHILNICRRVSVNDSLMKLIEARIS